MSGVHGIAEAVSVCHPDLCPPSRVARCWNSYTFGPSMLCVSGEARASTEGSVPQEWYCKPRSWSSSPAQA